MEIIKNKGVVSEADYNEYASYLSQWGNIGYSIIENIKKGNKDKATEEILNKCTPALNKVVEKAISLDDIADKESRKAAIVTFIFAVAGVVCIIVCLSTAWVLAKRISKKVLATIITPLKSVENTADELMKGNLHSTLDYKSDDELGRLAHSLRNSIAILGSYVDDIDRAMKLFAEGNFDVKPEVEWKSVFSAALASAAGKRNRQTLLISGDSRISMLSFFCGNTDADGLGTLYAGEITSQRTADAIKILREFPNIGVMGFQIHERKRQEGTTAQIQQLYTVLDGMAEVVIWDGTSDWTDAFQTVMTAKAEVTACLLTADVKGLLYFKQYQDKIRRLTHCLLLEGLSKPYSLHEEMDVTIGGFDGILPFGREIERYVMEGNLFSILTCCHTRYRETVEHTLDDLLEGRMEK